MSAGRDSTLTISKSCAESERKSKDNIKVKTTFFIEYRNSITNAAKITDFALWEVTKNTGKAIERKPLFFGKSQKILFGK
jgi:hypothetical protein